MAADGSVIIDTRMDTTGVRNGVSAIKQSFNDLGSAVKKINLGSAVKKIGLLIGGAFAVGKLAQFGKECVELGSDLTEVQNVVDVTFTTMSDKVNEFAKNAMTSAGLSETMAKRYVGTFGAMSKSFGFSEAQAYDMSTALAQLTGDVASFYNISQDLAYTKLKSVFTGETETLKDLGVVMSQSALDQYALANGYGKTTSEMTEQEKVALRLAFVQKQLSAASGDFIRTSDSWANQVRVMQLQLQSLKATVGQGLINIFTPVLKVINILLGKLATLANAFKSFTELITGKKSSGQTSGSGAGLAGTGAIADTADQYGQAADNAEHLADATNDTAKATKKANKETKNYLSSLDEVHKAISTGSDSSSTPSSSGGSGGAGSSGLPSSVGNVDYGNLAEGETVLDKISDSAKKLAKLIKKEDWEGLGTYIASGINKGLQKIYDVINWNNVGPKITKFCDAFTRTFNSLVDNVDWKLLGRTVGAGINTVVNTLNLLITGIDWKNLGKKFAEGITGLVKEVNWNNLGQLIANRFMITWDIFNGMVHNLPFSEIGRAIADGLNGICSRISFREIADTLATGLNGAFTTLYSFTERFDWSELVNNIAGGINTFVSEFDWKANGRKLEAFLDNLCGSLVDMAEKTDWEAFGKGVGDMLTQVDWLGHLKQVIKAVVKSLGGLFDGMEASGTAGKIAAFLGKAFIAVKIADITGISDLIKLLLKAIGKKLIGSEAIGELSGNLTTLLGNAVKGAAGSFTSLASAITPLVGTAGLIAGVGVAAAAATSELAKMVETMQGGNGVGGTFGNTMDNFIQTLQRRGDIISGSATEIWNLKESLEKEGMTAEEKSSATQKLIDKLGEMGVTSDQAEQAFSTLYQQGLITDDMFGILSESIKTLGDNTTNMAGSIDLGKQSIDDLYNNVLPQLQTQLGLSADQVTSLDTALLETESAGGTAQDAFNNIMERAEEMGLNTESVAKIFAQVFPDAVKETANSAEISMSSTQSSIETGMGAAATAVGTAMFGIQTDTEKAMSAAERAVSDSTGNISTDSEINWAAAEGFATGSVEEVGRTTYENMKAVYGVVSRYNASIKDDFDTNWGDSQNTVINAIQGMADEIERNGDRLASGVKNAFSGIPGYITDILNNAVGKVNSAIGNINGALGSIERSFTFTYNYTNPFNNRRNTYRSYLNLNRANTVPYLASGAVIPPRSEFLAVLGDQKKGRNLEAPEDLLRQIVREETGGNHGRGGNYRFTAQLNRRTIFDEMIDEAKLRRDASGTNPFELA